MQNNLSLFIAFSGGFLSFLSPCVLPMIPSYLSLLLGNYAEEKGKESIIFAAILFITGFSAIFILLGISASFLGQILLQNIVLLRKISGIIIIILGFHLSGLFTINALYRGKNFSIPENMNIYFRAPIMGIAMAFGWTPCVGPILSSILLYAGTGKTVFTGGLLLGFYSLGFALPFLLTAIFLEQVLPKFKKINPYLPLVQKIAGIFLIILGILIYFNYLQIFTQL